MAEINPKQLDKSMVKFGGVNTQADRKRIGDDQFSWLENVQPIGDGNAKAVNAPSAAVATLTGETCYYMERGNIGGTEYMYMFCTSGSCYQINLTSYVKTTVAAAGTFSGTVTRMAQWKNERIVIIDTTYGYFDWDGTTLTKYKGALASATVTAAGKDYTSAPTVTPASGSATFTASIGCELATLSAGGTGYVVGDLLTVVGGTFTTAATITVASVSSGAITGINLTTPGIYAVAPSNPVSVTGGYGSGATFTLNFGLLSVALVNPGSGYVTAPTLNLIGGGGSGATVIATLAINSTGTTIDTYAGRVWIGNNRTIVFSAPNSYSDFDPVDLAGSFIMSDSTLSGSIIRLISANNFLYIFGATSINVISNVTVTSPTYDASGNILVASTTTFSNTNVEDTVGTEMDGSVVSFNRTMMFAVDYGFLGLTGSTPQKMSDDLDGVFPYFDFVSSAVTGGTVVINNIMCLAYLVQYDDPTTGTARPLLCIYFNKKWFFASQTSTLTYIATGYPDADVPSLWGTDGTSLYKMFGDSSASIAQTVQTKLWDMGSPLIMKQALKLGLEVIAPAQISILTAAIDTEWNSTAYDAADSNTMTWYNNANQVITWYNNATPTPGVIEWLSAGYIFNGQDVSAYGNYLGVTLTDSAPGMTYAGIHMQYAPRTPWVQRPW